jgi:hypothetical protein
MSFGLFQRTVSVERILDTGYVVEWVGWLTPGRGRDATVYHCGEKVLEFRGLSHDQCNDLVDLLLCEVGSMKEVKHA